jgi:hypothetical protein
MDVQLCPDDKLLRELDSSLDKSGWAGNSVFTNPPPGTPSCINPSDPRDIAASAIRTLNEPIIADDDNAHLILADNLRTLSIDPVDYRFFGKSSGAMLIQTAIELKNEYTGSDHDLRKAATVLGTKREEFWSPHPVRHLSAALIPTDNHLLVGAQLLKTQTRELHFSSTRPHALPL